MNEKIKEFVKRSTDYTWTGKDVSEELDQEKFAELIVRECAEVLDKHIAPPSHPMNSLGAKVKQHFGVEP